MKQSRPDLHQSESESLKLIHELEVHQIELKMQNEELLLARATAQKAAEKYTDLFDFAPTGYFTLSKEGKIIELNLTGAAKLGKERARLKSSLFAFFVADNSKPIFNQFLRKIFISRVQESCEVALSSSDNITSQVYLSGIVTGDRKQCLINAIDITDRKQAEEAVTVSETRYRRLFETAKDGILILDAESGMIVDANPFLINLLGFSEEQLINKEIWEIGLFRDIAANKDKFSELQRKKYVRYEHLPLETAAGKKIHVEFVSNVYAVDHHNVIQCNIRDITKRREAETKLGEKDVQYRNLANAGIALIRTTDTDKSCNYFNDPWLKFTGHSLKHELGNGWIKGVHPDDFETYFKIYTASFEERESFEIEYRLRHISGKYRWMLDQGTPNYDSSGGFIGFIMHSFDVTNHKQIEQDLIEAKEKAEESDRLKSAFLANMSHEIRTPMNGILGFTELLKEVKLTDEKQQKYIRIIEQSGTRMLNIINDIISISKVESGQMEVTLSRTNVNDQIEYIYTFFKPAIEQKGMQILLKNTLPAEEATISTDREKVYAILTNLVKNAIKFTQAGSIEIGYEKKGGFLEFFVKDTGSGITNDQKKIVFDRFRQGNESLTRSYEGAGLGLSISKAYVELLGGEIWLESKAGKGSTFYFTIPYHAEQEEDINMNEFSDEAEENQINNLKILIAEDNKLSEMLISIAVEIYSKEVLLAKNGIEAVEACRKNPDIDLVLMDIHMPNMDGYEATRQIRHFNKDVIIIAQTANALTGEREKVIAAGCNDYISKPFNQTLLRKLIHKYFS